MDLLTVREVAEILRVSCRFVRRDLIGKGVLPVIALGMSGKADRVSKDDLNRFMESRPMRTGRTPPGVEGSAI